MGCCSQARGLVAGIMWISKLKAGPIPSKNVSAAGFVVLPTLHRRIWSHVQSLTLALVVTQIPFVFPSLLSTWNHISKTYQFPFPKVPTRANYENKTLKCQRGQKCKGRLRLSLAEVIVWKSWQASASLFRSSFLLYLFTDRYYSSPQALSFSYS